MMSNEASLGVMMDRELNKTKVALNRAESLLTIRNLVVLGIEKQVTDKNQLINTAREHKVLTTESSQRHYGRSSSWRYISSLIYLGFDLSEDSKQIKWSSSAFDLYQAAKYLKKNNTLDNLTGEEKLIFRQQIFQSNVREKFLSHFCACDSLLNSINEFYTKCQPLYIIGSKRRPQQLLNKADWKHKTMVEFTLNPNSSEVRRESATDFLHWYRLWCLDAGLIEELNAKEAVRSGMLQKQSHILYPLKNEAPPDVKEFIDILYINAGNQNKVVVVPILKLLYKMCVDLRITVHTFKDLLITAWKTNRSLFHLERGPGVLIKGNLSTTDINRPYSERFRNHRYYIIVDGTVRTNLVLMPRKQTI